MALTVSWDIMVISKIACSEKGIDFFLCLLCLGLVHKYILKGQIDTIFFKVTRVHLSHKSQHYLLCESYLINNNCIIAMIM